mmetsp:Transcript_102220/g.298102  ORF Transcript_102220/g.298102 Transcript_102220/m.298102 type:complete len:210 (+) Transcript_102220:1632-2261(+)
MFFLGFVSSLVAMELPSSESPPVHMNFGGGDAGTMPLNTGGGSSAHSASFASSGFALLILGLSGTLIGSGGSASGLSGGGFASARPWRRSRTMPSGSLAESEEALTLRLLPGLSGSHSECSEDSSVQMRSARSDGANSLLARLVLPVLEVAAGEPFGRERGVPTEAVLQPRISCVTGEEAGVCRVLTGLRVRSDCLLLEGISAKLSVTL